MTKMESSHSVPDTEIPVGLFNWGWETVSRETSDQTFIQNEGRMSGVSHWSIFLQTEHIFLFVVTYQIILNSVLMPSTVFSSLITNLLIPPRVLAAAKVRHSPSI